MPFPVVSLSRIFPCRSVPRALPWAFMFGPYDPDICLTARVGVHKRIVFGATPQARRFFALRPKHGPGKGTAGASVWGRPPAMFRQQDERSGCSSAEPYPGLTKTGQNFDVLGLSVFSEFVALPGRMSLLTRWNGSFAWMRQRRKHRRRIIRPHTGFRLGSSAGVVISGNRNTWISRPRRGDWSDALLMWERAVKNGARRPKSYVGEFRN